MATVTLRPNSDAGLYEPNTVDVYNTVGGVNSYDPPFYVVIDETTVDYGDFIMATNGLGGSLHGFPSSGIPMVCTVNKVTLYAHMSNGSASNRGFYLNDFNTYYVPDSAEGGGESYLHVLELSTNPDTSSPWALTDVNNIEVGHMVGADGKATVKLFQLYIVIDYTEGQSGTTHEGEVALSSLSYLRTKKA